MKITEIRCRDLTGTLPFDGVFWEERLARPIDIYPEYRAEGAQAFEQLDASHYRMRAAFLELRTDSGVTGLAGPVSPSVAHLIQAEFAGLLMGKDPRAHELIWDQMYRAAVHGRKGISMMAISAIDNALWDIRGKWANGPVYRLLGGPTRDRIPAYASMLGYSVEPGRAAERAREFAARGYRAQKWFFRASPAEGYGSIERNVALVRAVREAIGPEADLMLDCWMSWDLRYARLMAPHLAPLNPRWIEEPALPDKPEICAQIRQSVPFPVSNGEHEYTRWGFRRLLELGAQDVLQPDIYWAGGLSEVLKIAALASAYDVEVIPHGHSTHATAHFSAAMPPNLTPMQEYLDKWNTIHQFFIKDKLAPVDGYITVPEAPGMGMEIDPDLVEHEALIR
jgi:L-alanine-DL-glutamate epimerase-like enolase superfamily enzyme